MKMRFQGKLDDLKAVLAPLHLQGDWAELANGVWKFTRDDRAGLLWSSTQGTLWFDGPAPASQRLSQLVTIALSEAQDVASRASDRIVFVVGGHTEARDEVERVLNNLGIESYASKVIGGGASLIDVLEGMSGTRGEVAFGIAVLETAEVATRISLGEHADRPRASANTVLEAGMLMSAFKRTNCVIIHHQHLELPSKLESTPSIRFRNTVHEAMPELIQCLRTAGFVFDDTAVRRALR